MDIDSQAILDGSVTAAARLMRAIDDRDPGIGRILRRIRPHAGRAHLVGITGPPGAGKSTLTDRVIGALRRDGRTVGVVAIDPTSPFSGGAILGDRARMQRHAADPGVFIRSLASRGQTGGLSRSARDIVMLLDAMGKDTVIVETVGVGQDGVAIMQLVQTSIVVSMPGMGDGLQAVKAGILEVGDIFVVNKADLAGAQQAAREMHLVIEMNRRPRKWHPPVVLTEARQDRGIDELMAAVADHRRFVRRHRRQPLPADPVRRQLTDLVAERLLARGLERLQADHRWQDTLQAVRQGRLDPQTAAEDLVESFLDGLSENS